MEQLQVPQSASVYLLDSFQTPFDKLRSFDGLDNGWLSHLVRCLEIL